MKAVGGTYSFSEVFVTAVASHGRARSHTQRSAAPLSVPVYLESRCWLAEPDPVPTLVAAACPPSFRRGLLARGQCSRRRGWGRRCQACSRVAVPQTLPSRLPPRSFLVVQHSWGSR